jgi:hypothetical protein
MAQVIEPVQQLDFNGVVTAGHPLQKPWNAAKVCSNFRVMPGASRWLRLRSGRKARMYNDTGTFLQFFEDWKIASKIVQFNDGTTATWQIFGLSTWSLNPFVYFEISDSYGGSFAKTSRAPIAKINDRIVMYNGLGVRDASNSRPPFMSRTPSNSRNRYFGLDAYCPTANPVAAFTAGAGYNKVSVSVQIFVGLYNETTGHYSNGVYAGTIAGTAGVTGTIAVSDLQNLTAPYLDSYEQGELHYVFYATIDGGAICYQIFNSALNGPHTADLSDTSTSLSITAATTNGWVLNLDGPMQVDNHPPRPMSDLAFVNGRAYGIPLVGGSGSAVLQQWPDGTQHLDFTYQPSTAAHYQEGRILYSKAASDVSVKQMLGVPEEAWPLDYWTPIPNSELAIRIVPAPDGYRLLVLTSTTAFLVGESLDGYHEWKQISPLHGIANSGCIAADTPHGVAWLTQRNQIALLRPGAESVAIISGLYQSLLSGLTPRFMVYLSDPLNDVDRVEVFFTDGTSVIHDFILANDQFPDGQAYSSTGQDFTAGATLSDSLGQVHHVVAKKDLYTREGQGDDSGNIVTYDESYAGADTTTKANITGSYEFHWSDFGAVSLKKAIPHLDVIGDQLATLHWYCDLKQVTDVNKQSTDAGPIPQIENYGRRHKLARAHMFYLKCVIGLTGDYSTYGLTYSHPSEEGSLGTNFNGCIVEVRPTVSGQGENRP